MDTDLRPYNLRIVTFYLALEQTEMKLVYRIFKFWEISDFFFKKKKKEKKGPLS